MTDEELQAQFAALWLAFEQMNQNQQAIHTNFHRMSVRMSLHEAYQASEEMNEPRSAH